MGKGWGGGAGAMWVGGGRCHLISDIFCNGGDGLQLDVCRQVDYCKI